MDYLTQFKGRFIGVMHWQDCHALLKTLHNNPGDWYLYDTLEIMPASTLDAQTFIHQLERIKDILVAEHTKRYCGIVYTDDLTNPTFVKIFHPNNLGKSCGSSDNPPMPQWLLSKKKPMDVVLEFGPKEAPKGFISKYLKF